MTPVSFSFENSYNSDVIGHKKNVRIGMAHPTNTASPELIDSNPQEIASRLVDARRQAKPLDCFPGAMPRDLNHAYQIQDAGIDLWDQTIGGWKVGRIPLDLEDGFGIDRLAGPIFANTIKSADSGVVTTMPMYAGGFAAIEAEFVAVIDQDAPADKLNWSTDDALAMIGDLRIGLEIASSPLAEINNLGPTIVVSDFGNNLGLIVGPSVADWRERSLESMRCSSVIDDQVVGEGGASNLTGGFVRSVQFLLELLARRGQALRAGDMIATGQTNGIHDIKVSQVGEADFGDDGSLAVKMLPAQPVN